jgi:hypothetical protein
MNEELYNDIRVKANRFEQAFDRRPTMLFVDAKTLMNMYKPGPSPFGTELCRFGKVDGMAVYEARDRFVHYDHPHILEVA